jgi:hypothetical protein
MDVVKGDDLTALISEMDCDLDGDGLTTCHVCSVSHSWIVLVVRASRRNYWDVSATPSGIKREGYVCVKLFIIFYTPSTTSSRRVWVVFVLIQFLRTHRCRCFSYIIILLQDTNPYHYCFAAKDAEPLILPSCQNIPNRVTNEIVWALLYNNKNNVLWRLLLWWLRP